VYITFLVAKIGKGSEAVVAWFKVLPGICQENRGKTAEAVVEVLSNGNVSFEDHNWHMLNQSCQNVTSIVN
jgi:hypothetical protein